MTREEMKAEIARLKSALAAAECEADALYDAAYQAFYALERVLFSKPEVKPTDE